MNQKLKQYLWFFVDHRQKNQLKRLTSTEFVVNSKVHLATKVSLFIAYYKREIRMRADIRKKKKIEKMIEFVEKMKRIQKETEMVLKKAQEGIKRQIDSRKKEAKVWKEKQGHIKYKRISVQRVTSQKVSRLLCGLIHH